MRPNDLISVPKAAAMCQCSKTAVYRWIFRGQIRGWRRGATRWFVSRAEVEALFEQKGRPLMLPQASYADLGALPS